MAEFPSSARDPRIDTLPIPISIAVGVEYEHDGNMCRFLGWSADSRAQIMSPDGLLLFPDRVTGLPACPDKALLLELMAKGTLKLRAPRLSNAARERARRRLLSKKEVLARTSDPVAPLRMIILKAFDRDQPAKGDKALETWRDQILEEGRTRAEYGIWPAGATIRKWIRERGRPGNRLWSDTTSEKGRKRGARRHRSVQALALWHAQYVARQDGNIWSAWNLYSMDHDALLKGGELSVKLAEPLPRPPGNPTCYGYEWFRQKVHALRHGETLEAKYGRRGRRKHFGGGGASPEVTKLFEAVQLDAQYFPAFTVVDVQHRAVVGVPCVSLTIDRLTKVVPGCSVDGGSPSTTTLMQTIADVWRPSSVPARFAAKYPELALIGGAFDALEMDSGAENMSRAMQDLTGDVGFEIRIATPDERMDKSDIENLQRVVQNYLARELPSRVLDVRTCRELGLDPAARATVSVEVFAALLREAIATYHVQHHDGLGTTPLEAFLIARNRDGQDWPADTGEWEMMAADVEWDVRFDRRGFTLPTGLKYSCSRETPRLLAEELAVARGRGKAALNGYVKRKVKFKRNDLAAAWIWSEAREEYVRLPCTRPDYANGLSLWLHLKIEEFAGRTGRPLITEKDQIEARAGLVALVRSVTEAADASLLAMQFKLLASEATRACVGDSVDLLRGPASPDGPDDAIHRSSASAGRRDANVKQPRGWTQEAQDAERHDAAITALLSLENASSRSTPVKRGEPSPSGLAIRKQPTAPHAGRSMDHTEPDVNVELGEPAVATTGCDETSDPHGACTPDASGVASDDAASCPQQKPAACDVDYDYDYD